MTSVSAGTLALSAVVLLGGLVACSDPGPPRDLGEVRGVDDEVHMPPSGSPLVTLETTMGRITIGLYQDRAPVTVDNFLRYVEEGHYDGTIFHRVVDGFVVQGGGFEPGMRERPTRDPIPNEAGNGLANLRGTVAMARTRDPDSATSQFFVNVANNRSLDPGNMDAYGYAVFGVVVDGMDVVQAISRLPVGTHHGREVPRQDVLVRRAYRDGHIR